MVLHCHACNVVPCHLITDSRMGPVTIAFFVSVSLSSAGLLSFVGVGVGGELMPMLEEVLRGRLARSRSASVAWKTSRSHLIIMGGPP